ncbi:hypothetical protein HOLleu_11262 [Holothuria leucospilota]|uniref:Uncharacterized protein n=1 Tax=Holothuria leucospilota TaxID=206669 RepID=A0A9Q1CEE6_HOLLE|nr:hypothetical protein HOLleu_11262 [Holothuria leucospilota]
MDRINFDYSTKCIPTSSKGNFMKKWIETTISFKDRLRKRAWHFLHPDSQKEHKDAYGFKSRKPAQHIKELEVFENELDNLIAKAEWKTSNDKFQQKLPQDLRNIKQDKRLTVKADKTTNYYKMEAGKYKSLIHANITKDYKKANPKEASNLNKEAKKLAVKLELDDRIDQLAEKEVFLSLQDHKDNFQNKPTCRLISPTKTEIGQISKHILDRAIISIKNKTTVNLWKSTRGVLD